MWKSDEKFASRMTERNNGERREKNTKSGNGAGNDA